MPTEINISAILDSFNETYEDILDRLYPSDEQLPLFEELEDEN